MDGLGEAQAARKISTSSAALSRALEEGLIPDNLLGPMSCPLASSPPCRGRAREGVETQPSSRANPHPSLPPKRGKGQFGFNDLSGLMQNTRHTQHELRDLDLELRTLISLHLVAAAHRADLCGQHRAAGIFEALARF